jgi:hypothetical protein
METLVGPSGGAQMTDEQKNTIEEIIINIKCSLNDLVVEMGDFKYIIEESMDDIHRVINEKEE